MMNEQLVKLIAENIEYNEMGTKRPIEYYVKWTTAVLRVAKAMGYELRKATT